MNAESTPTQSLNSSLSYFSAASVIFIAVHGLQWQGQMRLNRAERFDEADHMRHAVAPPKVASPESVDVSRCRSRVGATVSGIAAEDLRAMSHSIARLLSPSAPTRSAASGVERTMPAVTVLTARRNPVRYCEHLQAEANSKGAPLSSSPGIPQ